jgi:hypothetical protein
VDIVTQNKDAAQSIVSQKKEKIEIVTPFTLLFAVRSWRHLGIHYQQSQRVTCFYSSSLSGG